DHGADVVTTTTHKTLGGPRAGVIMCKQEYAKKIDSAVFPGQQGGPLEHVIAAKAVAFKIAASELFAERQRRTVDGARAGARLRDTRSAVKRSAVPLRPPPPMEASGLRIGTPALATRGLQHEDFAELGRILAAALTPQYDSRAGELADRVAAIVERYPLYEGLGAAAVV